MTGKITEKKFQHIKIEITLKSIEDVEELHQQFGELTILRELYFELDEILKETKP